MKKILPVITCVLVVMSVFSCKSTGTTAAVEPSPAPVVKAESPVVPAPEPAPIPEAKSPVIPEPEPDPLEKEEITPAPIYERHEVGIILTGALEYTVVKGDTLSKIARNHYGTGLNGYFFPLIIAASKNITDIVDPDQIEVGMKLVIPSLQENLDNPEARDNLKSLLKEIAGFYSRKSGRLSRGLYNGLTRLYDTL